VSVKDDKLLRVSVPERIWDRLRRVCQGRAFGYQSLLLRRGLMRVLKEEEEKLERLKKAGVIIDEFEDLG